MKRTKCKTIERLTIQEFLHLVGLRRFGRLARDFISRNRITTVSELLETSVALADDKTYRALRALRDELLKVGFVRDQHRFTMYTI